jgi:BAI1-associated protein 3
LQDIPSTGLDVWLDLKGRSARSKVEGKVHLKLSLATREDRGLPEDERQFETKQHYDLMLIFIGHELKKSKVLLSDFALKTGWCLKSD